MSDRWIEVFRPALSEDAIQAAVATLRSGWIGSGPRVKEFEEKFCEFVDAEFCLAVNTGTAALHLALKALDLPPRSKVITSPISHVATIRAIQYVNCIPVYADVDRETGNISVTSVRRKLDKDTRAIVCTHMGGYPCDLTELNDEADAHGIPFVEDCSHAAGSTYEGKRIGHGTLCCFSLSFPKPITGIEGGAITTSNVDYFKRARKLAEYGRRSDRFDNGENADNSTPFGYKYSWNDVMATIALAQLRSVDEAQKRRKLVAERYLGELSGEKSIYLPSYTSDRMSSYFFLPLFFERRDDLQRKLAVNHVRSKIYFRCYPTKEDVPNARWYDEHELTLPLHLGISDSDIEYILSLLKDGW